MEKYTKCSGVEGRTCCTEEVKSEVIYPLRLSSGVPSSSKPSLLDSLLRVPTPRLCPFTQHIFRVAFSTSDYNFCLLAYFFFEGTDWVLFSVVSPCLTWCLSQNILELFLEWNIGEKTMTARLEERKWLGRYLGGKMDRTWRSIGWGGISTEEGV